MCEAPHRMGADKQTGVCLAQNMGSRPFPSSKSAEFGKDGELRGVWMIRKRKGALVGKMMEENGQTRREFKSVEGLKCDTIKWQARTKVLQLGKEPLLADDISVGRH